jgi:hypothetical protein
MLIVLFEIIVFQPMFLLVGGDADIGERLVGPKLLEWLRRALRHAVAAGIGCS